WQGVSLSLAALADPRVLDAVSPAEGEEFDPEAFIRERGTLFLLATGAGAGNSAALVAALVEDLVETARKIAARSRGARLDPPLLLALDEIGNLAPLPSLPTLMAEGGGTGITTLPVLQSLAQARDKWNDNAAGAIWDASIVKIILGGASNSRDLQDLSTLIGERDEYTDSVTLGDHGTRSNQRSVRRVPILPPDRIRTLPFGTGVTLLRSAPPIVTDLRAWPSRPDADQLREDRAEIEALLLRPFPHCARRTRPAGRWSVRAPTCSLSHHPGGCASCSICDEYRIIDRPGTQRQHVRVRGLQTTAHLYRERRPPPVLQ